jgi:tRNA(Ser,Leu) C12 N-acetylase TAN1
MMVGDAPIYFSLKKQNCVSKSHTEAELVVLSDNVWVIELLQELLAYMVDMALPDTVVLQDNTSVTLITQGAQSV